MSDIDILAEFMCLDDEREWKYALMQNSNISEEFIEYLADVAQKFKANKERTYIFFNIRRCVENGFNLEKIKLYANPVFDTEQLEQILTGLLFGLTTEQVKVYADDKFGSLQMEKIRQGFQDGLTFEQVGIYAKTEFDYNQMKEIRLCIEHGLTPEQIKICGIPAFQSDRIRLLRRVFEEKKLDINHMVALNYDQICQVIYGFESNLSSEQIAIYANPKFSSEQMKEIRKGLCLGLNMDQVSAYAKVEIPSEEMKKAYLRLKNQIVSESLDFECETNFNFDQLVEINDGFARKLTVNQIRSYANPEFKADQMAQICAGYVDGLSESQVKSYIDPELTGEDMHDVRWSLEGSMPIETIIRKAIEKNKKES